MRKILFGALMIAIALSGSIAVSKVALADDPVCLPGEVLINGVCQAWNGADLNIIKNSYCKPGQVVYSEWSECDKRFGKTGLQWRQIQYPTPGGCNPSVYDQVSATRECLK